MEYVAFGTALVALVVALIARSQAAGMRREVEEARDDARRRVQNAVDEQQRSLDVLRRLTARVASGESVPQDMILEGRLWRDVGTREAVQLVASGRVRVLDVRTRSETASGVIPGALVIPVDELEARVRDVPKTSEPLLVCCAAGARSAAACEFLASQGHENLLNLEGGMSAWNGPRSKP